MFKILRLFLSVCVLLGLLFITAFSAVDVNPKPLVFEHDKSGKYIYCNNHEFITREHLSDTSREFPTYIMNNTLEPDNYAMFVSHVNHTELRDSKNNITEIGFDIEVDVEFKAVEDVTFTIKSVGFEVPEHSMYYYYSKQYKTEEEWGCMNAWANYLGVPIREINSGTQYNPQTFEMQTVTLKAGETYWLSSCIDNYSVVPFYRPVHILADFEITSGKCEVNVCALKSNGTVKYRGHHSRYASFGTYIPEKQYKGIANSLNKADAYLEYTIADWVGGKLPVTVYNDYAPNGNSITDWFTHLNHWADPWNKENTVASDMLSFEYKDPSKLKYYGAKADKDKINDVWVFDNKHTDFAKYPGKNSGYSVNEYIPNDLIADTVNNGGECNLGNYGVSLYYHFTIHNEGKITRYANYNLSTISNNIVILRDKDGNMLQPYALCKGSAQIADNDVMACVELPGNTTTSFIIEVILPTNYVGGMRNSLEIVNSKSIEKVYDNVLQKIPRDYSFTGREFIKWENGKLYKSTDKLNWEYVPLNAETEKIFHGNWNEYEFLYTDNGYMAKVHLYDSKPYYGIREFFKNIYFLDNNFNLVKKAELYQYPTAMSYAKGIYYITAGSNYSSTDGENWEILDGSFDLPCWNYGENSVKMVNGEVYVSTDGTNYNLVKNSNFKPYFVKALGDVYYSISGNKLYLSKDAISWKCLDAPEAVSFIERIGDSVVINKKYTYTFTGNSAEFIKIGDTICAYPEPYGIYNGEKFYSINDLADMFNIKISWQGDTAVYSEKCITYADMRAFNGVLCTTLNKFLGLIY